MTIGDIRGKSGEELRSLSGELRDEIFRLRMQHFMGQLDKPSRVRELRRTIARVETVLTERAGEGR